jgi:hypothetical protein
LGDTPGRRKGGVNTHVKELKVLRQQFKYHIYSCERRKQILQTPLNFNKVEVCQGCFDVWIAHECMGNASSRMKLSLSQGKDLAGKE